MKVLIACEESQTSCIAWRKKGHEAYSCDIQPCSGGHPEWHIQDDVTKFLKMPWDLVIAHPPCTYLSCAGTRHLYKDGWNQERYDLGVKAAEFFRKCLDSNAPKVAVENPMIFKCFGLPAPTQFVHPYYFGDPYYKRTYLWLRGLPPLTVNDTDPVYTGIVHWIGNDADDHSMKFKDSKTRSKSFPGLARAMADQWGSEEFLYLF